MKRIFAAILLLMLIFSLTGCKRTTKETKIYFDSYSINTVPITNGFGGIQAYYQQISIEVQSSNGQLVPTNFFICSPGDDSGDNWAYVVYNKDITNNYIDYLDTYDGSMLAGEGITVFIKK